MRQNEYLKTIFQVRRNLIAHLISELGECKPNTHEGEKLLVFKGKLDAYNDVLQEVENFQLMLFESEHPNVILGTTTATV